MTLSPPVLSLPRSSLSILPRRIPSNEPNPSNGFFKSFISNVRGLGPIRHFQTAASCAALCDSSDGEIEGTSGFETGKGDAFSILSFMEQRGVRPNLHTYASVLDACFSSRSLKGARRIHGLIMKLGIETETILSDRLFNAYFDLGDFLSAGKLFDDLSPRCVALMATALRACAGHNACWALVHQIHGRIIRLGLSADPIACNPLIDLYSKEKCIESAISVFDEMRSKDNVSWVAMASGLSQNGRGEEALNLYLQMHQSGATPTPYLLSSILSACAKTESFDEAMQIHAQAFKSGFCAETFVGNALISLYSRRRSSESVEKIFDEMAAHDGVTYNSMISGYVVLGNRERAICAFKQMQSSGFKPDSVTVASLLCACASIGAIQKGKQLHSYVLKSGLASDYIIEGSLLDLYVKCADIETSRRFFDSTEKQNVVLWNVMLVAYGQMGDLMASLKLFSEMLAANMEPNQYTYPSILRTCTYHGELDLGEQIHSMAIKTGFEMNIFVCSVLIDMYSKCGMLESGRRILARQTERDVVSWTAMIAGYAQHELYVEALKTFEEMRFHGVRPDSIGLSSAISACAGLKAVSRGRQIHAQACVLGYSADLSIGNALVNLYARCGMIMEAYSAFEANEVRDDVSWNALISGFGQSGHHEEALAVFKEMTRRDIKANLFTYGSAVSSSGNVADRKLGDQIHSKMIKTGYAMEVEAGNSLVSLYAKCGSIEDAERVFDGMPERNEISWNAIITAYSQHGRGKEALQLFERMKEEGLRPNHVTFVGVLTACSHVGLVTEGLGHFRSMREEHGLAARPEHFVCVVDILGRAGQLDRARRFVEDMPIEPDSMIWRSLLGASAVHKNVEAGEFAGRRLLELEPHDSATYVLLSNLYAVTRRWECRDRMRRVMKDRGVKKEPGRSWIEVKNEIHSFFVGDRLHRSAAAIYEHLEELSERAAEIGYRQERYCLMQEAEVEQKDATAWIHSEKLAVSFGDMELPAAAPIRVIKNIRVCADCHNWMKFVSRVAGRVIVLRDSYRFHHFGDGDCSCGDYW